jgi:protein TonB
MPIYPGRWSLPRTGGVDLMYAADAGRARPSRLIGGVLAAVLQLALIVLVWTGFSPQFVRNGVQNALTSLDLRVPPKPPPPPRAAPHRAHAASGKAAPAHIRSHAAPIVAPPVPVLKPPPVPAASIAGNGVQNAAGAAPVPGPGSGAGGIGQGTGSGGSGDGEGDGGRDVELTSGRIKDSDIPPALRGAPFSGTTRAQVEVGASGRVSGCRTLRSSGNATLDELTCRLIVQRFRFRPALDEQGRARADTIIYEQEWVVAGQFESDDPAR